MIFLIDLVKVFLKLVLMLVKLCIVLSVDLCLIVFLYVGFIFFFVRVICCSVKLKIDMYFFVGFIKLWFGVVFRVISMLWLN